MRRGAHEALGKHAVQKYTGMQEREAALLVGDFLKNPEHWDAHLRRAAASLVLGVIYGLPPLRNSLDPDIVCVNRFVERALHAAAPGSFLVEYFTWMEYLPRWMSPWRRYAEDSFAQDSMLFERLFAEVKARVASGDHTPSVAATIIGDENHLDLTEKEASWLSATLYAAGAETTSGQLAWFMLAMLLYPDTQKLAQDEIDRVVGHGRLPSFSDFEQLHYTRALVMETLRWRAVPHRLSQDDYYEGYHLKKGTICVVNVWSLNHDPEVYGPNADEFEPRRHLDQDGNIKTGVADTKAENHHTFGFGRRPVML
ncbi:hypothetical protein D9758_015612 [Tetrapyrgos nigripes]|uniref:Cytochrome P450 n=1 Tax=Tetrapyrgos nigripes TaxID=182062 RepID=A0A8H5CKF9_9AGAR|nr:hypothetical protein D9758_015612 [Tetrapyrgos nigripes]